MRHKGPLQVLDLGLGAANSTHITFVLFYAPEHWRLQVWESGVQEEWRGDGVRGVLRAHSFQGAKAAEDMLPADAGPAWPCPQLRNESLAGFTHSVLNSIPYAVGLSS